MANKAKLKWGDLTSYRADATKIRAEKELREEYSRLRDIAVKRIKRLQNSEYMNSEDARKEFPKLSGINNEAELRYRLQELASFVSHKTSSISGKREQRRKALETLSERGYDFVDESNYEEFYEWLKSQGFANAKYPSPEVVREAYFEDHPEAKVSEIEQEFSKREPIKPAPKMAEKNRLSSSNIEANYRNVRTGKKKNTEAEADIKKMIRKSRKKRK